MSKRRRASELMYGTQRGLRYPVRIVAVLTGTGVETGKGIITVVASNTSTRCYITVASGTNIGTLVGTV